MEDVYNIKLMEIINEYTKFGQFQSTEIQIRKAQFLGMLNEANRAYEKVGSERNILESRMHQSNDR